MGGKGQKRFIDLRQKPTIKSTTGLTESFAHARQISKFKHEGKDD